MENRDENCYVRLLRDLQIHPTMRSSYIDGTSVGLSRVPLGPSFTDILNGSCEEREREYVHVCAQLKGPLSTKELLEQV